MLCGHIGLSSLVAADCLLFAVIVSGVGFTGVSSGLVGSGSVGVVGSVVFYRVCDAGVEFAWHRSFPWADMLARALQLFSISFDQVRS